MAGAHGELSTTKKYGTQKLEMLYLTFQISSPDSGYVWAEVAVRSVRGMDSLGNEVVYDNFKGPIASGVEDEFNVPKGFSLEQNYPNPFNPSTTIRYTVPQQGQVNLTIYNSLGQEIKKLVSEEKRKGNYEVVFNASNLPSGIYFYKLQTGSFVETKKMMLVK